MAWRFHFPIHKYDFKVTVDTRTRVVHPRDLGVVAETPTTLRRLQRAVEVDDDARPYTDLVNVQHPETTRQERRGRPEPKTYAARLSQLQPRHGECADHATRESLERLYGESGGHPWLVYSGIGGGYCFVTYLVSARHDRFIRSSTAHSPYSRIRYYWFDNEAATANGGPGM